MYNRATTQIRLKDGLTEHIGNNIGVKQGCVLSPTLFKLFINDMHKLFDKQCDPAKPRRFPSPPRLHRRSMTESSSDRSPVRKRAPARGASQPSGQSHDQLASDFQLLRAQMASLVAAQSSPPGTVPEVQAAPVPAPIPPPPPPPPATSTSTSTALSLDAVMQAIVTAATSSAAASATALAAASSANVTGVVNGCLLGATMSPEHQKIVTEDKFLNLPMLDKEEYEEQVGSQLKYKQPKTFSLWLDLFLQYASVRMQAHPADGPHLLGYIQIMKNLAEKEEPAVWVKYDSDFRKLKASNSDLPWGDLHVQLLYKYLPGRLTSTAVPAKEAPTMSRGPGGRWQRAHFLPASGWTPA
jgi:hypothetical protein